MAEFEATKQRIHKCHRNFTDIVTIIAIFSSVQFSTEKFFLH